jgi:SAM-dependent methyltransferase
MPEDHFGEPVAATYDEDEAEMFDPVVLEPTVAFLAGLAGNGAALELGIGTGRLALPLAARGVAVHGIDLSDAMVERLRRKPGGEALTVTMGDFATTSAGRRFQLVYLAFNTIMNLVTQDAQVACFENAARHLEPGGAFVVEVMVPELQRIATGERVHAYTLTDERLDLDVYDVVTQGLVSHHLTRDGDGYRVVEMPFRYVWPSELDLMARLAGLTLHERVAGWDRAPFTTTSRSHVSVWVAPLRT